MRFPRGDLEAKRASGIIVRRKLDTRLAEVIERYTLFRRVEISGVHSQRTISRDKSRTKAIYPLTRGTRVDDLLVRN